MKKQSFIIIAALVFISTFQLYAQDSKKYKEMSAELEQSIWGTKDPMFETNTIPTEYKNESAVVLAQKHAIATDTKRKTGLFGLPTKNFIDKKIWKTFRQKIVINDQNSLNEFSEISFAKLDSKRQSVYFRSQNLAFTFIGIRLIKLDGTVQKINVDESAVTLKETKDGKKNKIAIPNLAIGDILDYYIASYDELGAITAAGFNTPEIETFVLSDEYPIVNFGIYMVLDKRVAAEYQSFNNAPAFKVTQKDEDNILELTATNLPKSKDLVWVSTYRQIPVVRIRYNFGNLHKDEFEIKKGEVKKNVNDSKRVEKEVQDILRNNFLAVYDSDQTLYALRSQFEIVKANLKKTRPTAVASNDSLAYLAYYLWRRNCFYDEVFTLKDDMKDADRGINLGQQLLYTLRMRSVYENGIKMDCEFVDATSRNSVTRKNLFELSDLSVLTRINAPKTQYLYLGNAFYNFGEVPTSLEGSDGAYFSIKPDKALFGKVKGYNIDNEGNAKIPILTKEDHSQETALSISLDPTDNQTLNFTRVVKAKGQIRRYFQASLLMPEDVVKEEMAYLGLPNDLVEEYKKMGRTQKKNFEEFTTILKKARDTEKEKFEAELKEELDEKVKELKSFTIINRGLHHTNNVFEMKEEFSVNAWVKKAGNNFIIEVGKLVGGQFEIKADQRERKLDIYMPYARMYTYTVDFTIPDGFSVEGIDKLNEKVENECGAFISTAVVKGNKLLITTKKYYNNIEEKAANWPKLTAFIDAAFEFGKEKILLKKK